MAYGLSKTRGSFLDAANERTKAAITSLAHARPGIKTEYKQSTAGKIQNVVGMGLEGAAIAPMVGKLATGAGIGAGVGAGVSAASTIPVAAAGGAGAGALTGFGMTAAASTTAAAGVAEGAAAGAGAGPWGLAIGAMIGLASLFL